jgi:hypothetical protein
LGLARKGQVALPSPRPRVERLNDISSSHLPAYSLAVVIVDRKAATQNHSSDPFLWNQPALSALQTPVGATNPAAFFARPRTRLIRHLLQGPDMHIPTLRKKRNKSFNGKQVKIVYFDQQGSNRRLVKEDHEFLVELLGSLEKQSRGRFGQKVFVEVVNTETMSAEDQVRSVLDADVSGVLTAVTTKDIELKFAFRFVDRSSWVYMVVP